jgi:hypothetical protein
MKKQAQLVSVIVEAAEPLIVERNGSIRVLTDPPELVFVSKNTLVLIDRLAPETRPLTPPFAE